MVGRRFLDDIDEETPDDEEESRDAGHAQRYRPGQGLTLGRYGFMAYFSGIIGLDRSGIPRSSDGEMGHELIVTQEIGDNMGLSV